MFFGDRHFFCSTIFLVLVLAGCSDNGSQPSKDPDEVPLTGHEYTWSSQTLSAPNTFQIQIRSIWGANLDNVWAVGHSDMPQHQVWRLMANQWVDQNTQFPGRNFSLNGIYGFSSNDIWCVGEENKSFPTRTISFIAHFNGSSWNPITAFTTTNCRAVWGTSSSNLFISCDSGRIAHFNGSTWNAHQTDTPRAQILSIRGSSPNNVYAAGISTDFVQPADTFFHHFYKLENSRWVTVQTFIERVGISSPPFGIFLWVDENSDLYSAGLWGIYRLVSGSWQRLEGYTALRSIGGSSSENLFVGGFNQQLHHFNGDDWLSYENFEDQSQFFWAIWSFEETVYLSSTDGAQTKMIYGEKVVE